MRDRLLKLLSSYRDAVRSEGVRASFFCLLPAARIGRAGEPRRCGRCISEELSRRRARNCGRPLPGGARMHQRVPPDVRNSAWACRSVCLGLGSLSCDNCGPVALRRLRKRRTRGAPRPQRSTRCTLTSCFPAPVMEPGALTAPALSTADTLNSCTCETFSAWRASHACLCCPQVLVHTTLRVGIARGARRGARRCGPRVALAGQAARADAARTIASRGCCRIAGAGEGTLGGVLDGSRDDTSSAVCSVLRRCLG